MIGPKNKSFKKKQTDPPEESIATSFKSLPKYISYRAALLREKVVLSYVITVICFCFGFYFITTRMEISGLHKQLRLKEYILAPGVRDFTVATPQSVPDSYISDAAHDFLSTLGNINATIIDERYESLTKFMSAELKIQFMADVKEWMQQIKTEDLAQIFHIKSVKIASNDQGYYAVTAFARADFYSSGQSLGHEEQVVEMILHLVPPERSKRWYLEITKLTWSKLDSFNTRKSLTNK